MSVIFYQRMEIWKSAAFKESRLNLIQPCFEIYLLYPQRFLIDNFCVLRRFFSSNGKFFDMKKYEQRKILKRFSSCVGKCCFMLLRFRYLMALQIQWRMKKNQFHVDENFMENFRTQPHNITFPLRNFSYFFPPQIISHNVFTLTSAFCSLCTDDPDFPQISPWTRMKLRDATRCRHFVGKLLSWHKHKLLSIYEECRNKKLCLDV